MDEEIINGYCVVQNSARMVVCEPGNNGSWQADCDYPQCPHADVCPIGKQILALKRQAP